MNISVYILAPKDMKTKQVHFLTSFRVAELNYHEKISLILDLEKSLANTEWNDFKVSLLWQSGFASGESFIWNEESGIKEISSSEKVNICSQSELKKIKLKKVFNDPLDEEMYQILPMCGDLLERFLSS